jgi:hypothetical protein
MKLHLRIAEEVERRSGNRLLEAAETLAHHYRQVADRARQLINRALQRSDELSSVPTTALALFFRAFLENLRHDAIATRDAAEALLVWAEGHGLRSYADAGRIYMNWARGRLLEPEAGAVELGRTLMPLWPKATGFGCHFFTVCLPSLRPQCGALIRP